jgi:mRNA interferase MazF
MPGSEPGFAAGQIVRIPFPYSDTTTLQHRPALVVATPADGFLLWVLMITSVANRGWVGDIAIPDHARCGLPAPSMVRTAKIATIKGRVAETRGALDPVTLAKVQRAVARMLGLST